MQHTLLCSSRLVSAGRSTLVHPRSMHYAVQPQTSRVAGGLRVRTVTSTPQPIVDGAPSSSVVAEPLPANPAAVLPRASISAHDGAPSFAPAYAGPLAGTLRRLKMFSLGSCMLTGAFTPFLFLLEAPLPTVARSSLAGTALAASAASTALVGWSAAPYVTALRRARGVGAEPGALELTTRTIVLRTRTTSVFDTAFLGPATRPFATWQLQREVQLPRGAAHPPPGSEETVAETADARGNVLGRWIVRWGEGGSGTCRESGHVVRHFHVHEELLDPALRLSGAPPPPSTTTPAN